MGRTSAGTNSGTGNYELSSFLPGPESFNLENMTEESFDAGDTEATISQSIDTVQQSVSNEWRREATIQDTNTEAKPIHSTMAMELPIEQLKKKGMTSNDNCELWDTCEL